MFSKLRAPFGIELDFVLASGGTYALLFYLWFNYVKDISTSASAALMRGLQYAACVMVSEIILRNFDWTGISFIRKLKDTVGVDLLSALLMIPVTNFVLGLKLYSLEFAPIVIGLAFSSDIVGHALVGVFNHPLIVGKEESIAISNQIADRKVAAMQPLPPRGGGSLPSVNPLEQQLY